MQAEQNRTKPAGPREKVLLSGAVSGDLSAIWSSQCGSLPALQKCDCGVFMRFCCLLGEVENVFTAP